MAAEVEFQSIHAGRLSNIIAGKYSSQTPIQYWYNHIHAYKKLIAIKQNKGKCVDVSRTVRTAKRKGIKQPKQLSIKQCQDCIAFARTDKNNYGNQQEVLERIIRGTALLRLRKEATRRRNG